jgi:hypothetical protein
MVVGKRFFGRASMAEIFDLVVSRSPKDEARQVAEFFPEIAPIVERLLQRDAKDRYDHPLKVAEKLRRIRQQIGSHGDLLQFSRLVRAGRLEPEERQGSLIALPALPMDAEDWVPLIGVAAGDGGPANSPWDTEPAGTPVKLGPTTGEPRMPDPEGQTKSGTQPLLKDPLPPPPVKPAPPPPPVRKVEHDPEAVATLRQKLPETVSVKDPAKVDLPPDPGPATDDLLLAPARKGPPWGAIAIIAVALLAAVLLILKTLG